MGEIAVSGPAQKKKGRGVVNGSHWVIVRWKLLDHLVEPRGRWIIVDKIWSDGRTAPSMLGMTRLSVEADMLVRRTMPCDYPGKW